MRCHILLRISLYCLVIAILTAVPAVAVESVRVDASSGSPRIVVDGKPVRARMFFGYPGVQWPVARETGREIAFEFSPNEDEPALAAMHLRFGNAPGNIYLDDIRCVDLNTGQDVFPEAKFEAATKNFHQEWSVWPPKPQNTVGAVSVEPGKGRDGSAGLHIAIKAPPDGVWPDFHVFKPNLALHKGHRYRVSLWARADSVRDLKIVFYRADGLYRQLGQPPDPFQPQIQLAADAGVDFVTFPMNTPWPRPGEHADWSQVDAQCQRVLEANPKALLLPRVHLYPPPWWYETHPDDKMVWDQGANMLDAVVASPAYRHDAAEHLAALVTHLEEKFGDHMAGYHPAGQNSAEWFYEDTWTQKLSGYAKGDLLAWRNWLKARYQKDVALQSAWHDPRVTLDSVAVPSPATRRAAPAGVLRDPVAERSVIDFAIFQQEAMADCVCHLAHAARQASRGRKLVVFFYGYAFEFGGNCGSVNPAASGHYAMRRVLNCPDIDVLCSPISYFDRRFGQSSPVMSAAESVALAGKMWFCEDDTRTHRTGAADYPACYCDADVIEKAKHELVRNTAQCAVRNFGTWWMDLYGTGWFNDPQIWAEMANLKNLDEALLRKPLPFRPEVVAVIDEQSMIRVAAGGQVATMPGVYEARRPLGRMGAPYGQYLQDDVAAGRVQAKMYVFLTAWFLSPSERRHLLDATRGSLSIWCYAPGLYEEDGKSLDAMRQLTGFQIKKVSPTQAWAEPSDAGRKLGLREAFGTREPIAPLFAAADATPGETLATYSDGSAAVALRRTSNGLSLFVGPPGLSSELLRLAARQAGVHLVTQTDCNVYANGPFLALHAAQDGPTEIDTGVSGPIHDLLTSQIVGQGPKIRLPLKTGETRVLRVGGM